jgi:RNA polymerase sigma-70 factor (ECF subfamily)
MASDKNATTATVRINNERDLLQARAANTSISVTDEQLAAQIAQGNSAALEALYDRHAPTVLGIALKVIGDRSMSEEVLQETFWRCWKSASTYHPERGTFTGWLFRIARNLAIDVYRRQNVRPQAFGAGGDSGETLDGLPDPDVDVAEQAQSTFTNRRVRQAMNSLPAMQRQVIEMAYFYGMTRQEIAEATGEALGTIHTRARLALQKLREELAGEEFEG